MKRVPFWAEDANAEIYYSNRIAEIRRKCLSYIMLNWRKRGHNSAHSLLGASFWSSFTSTNKFPYYIELFLWEPRSERHLYLCSFTFVSLTSWTESKWTTLLLHNEIFGCMHNINALIYIWTLAVYFVLK